MEVAFEPTIIARPSLGTALPVAPALGQLSVQVLKTPAERLLLAPLRQYADVQSEYEVDPGMAALDKTKDSIGVVMAIFQDGLPIATIRFVPGGHGVTVTERYWGAISKGTDILGPNNWEVGRLVMAPENRRADLLPVCMALSLSELLEHVEVEQFHASCGARMTRLYRRFGFSVRGTNVSPSGQPCALIHAPLETVARALKVPLQQQLAAMLQ